MKILETFQLTKQYTPKSYALKDLSMRVDQGEIFGFLGPNGAGKTTTIKLLLDLIHPSSGTAQLFGLDVNPNSVEIRRRIGFVPAELALWDSLTAQETIRFFERIHGRVDPTYITTLAERLDFNLSKKVRSYSTGNKRKLGLILAMMHQPELLILDEPTSGLDPLVQQTFYQLMKETRAEGRTVFLSSHVLSEVQAICDRVAILRLGELQTVTRVDTLIQTHFRNVMIKFAQPTDASFLRQLGGAHNLQVEHDTVHLRFKGEFTPLLHAVAHHQVVDMRVTDASLEEIFLTYYSASPHKQEANAS